MKSVMNCVQHATRFIPILLTYSAGTPSIGEGDNHVTVEDTGPGIATITFDDAFARAPIISATPVAATGVELFCVLRAVTGASFVVEITDEAGTLTDADVHIMVCGFDSADEA